MRGAPALDARFPTPRTAEALTAVENRRRRIVAASFLRGVCPPLFPPPFRGMPRTPPSGALREDMRAAMNAAAAAGDTRGLAAVLADAERLGDALRSYERSDLEHLHRARMAAVVGGTLVSLLWLAACLALAVGVGDVAGAVAAAAWVPAAFLAARAARSLDRPGDP